MARSASSANVYSYPVYDLQSVHIAQGGPVPHSPQEKKLVLSRVRRLRGQVEALERALEAGAECAPVLQQIAAVRGAVNGLMAGVLESHLREEFLSASSSKGDPKSSIDNVIGLVRSYLR
jgi:FrmR/RcnR family transcriptional regulator, repressor of frmRAB operon